MIWCITSDRSLFITEITTALIIYIRVSLWVIYHYVGNLLSSTICQMLVSYYLAFRGLANNYFKMNNFLTYIIIQREQLNMLNLYYFTQNILARIFYISLLFEGFSSFNIICKLLVCTIYNSLFFPCALKYYTYILNYLLYAIRSYKWVALEISVSQLHLCIEPHMAELMKLQSPNLCV